MKVRLKKDIVIPAGTVMESDGVVSIHYNPNEFVVHTLGFGKNASGDLRIGVEMHDKEFQEWFERVNQAIA